MTSVRYFVWRCLKRLDLLVEHIAKQFRHVVVKAKSGDDGTLSSEFSIRPDASTADGQAHNVLTTPVTARGNAVNDRFSSVCQVDENRLVAALYHHQENPPFPNLVSALEQQNAKWGQSQRDNGVAEAVQRYSNQMARDIQRYGDWGCK